jgi:hypothetical protein
MKDDLPDPDDPLTSVPRYSSCINWLPSADGGTVLSSSSLEEASCSSARLISDKVFMIPA